MAGSGAHAQYEVAAPYYNSAHEMSALYRHHYVPRSQALVAATDTLADALQTLCAAPAPAPSGSAPPRAAASAGPGPGPGASAGLAPPKAATASASAAAATLTAPVAAAAPAGPASAPTATTAAPASASAGAFAVPASAPAGALAASASAPVAVLASPAPVPAAALDVARARWRDSLVAWQGLSAVQIGPLIERRSARSIDFQPARPALIAKAVQAAPAEAGAMERIGAPAKGFPALEWLLWTQPAAPQSAECRYAQALAADLGREARALASGYAQLAASEGDDATLAFAEFINQWIGGIDRLRWAGLEKPVRSAGKGKPIEWAHAASGSAVLGWQAQWQALRSLSRGPALPIGDGLISVEAYLRGHGLNPLANRLAAEVGRVDQAMQRIAPAPAPALEAARRLGALKALIEKELAPAVEVTIGFSDADGD